MLKITLHGADIVFNFNKEDKDKLLTKREIWQSTRHSAGSGFNTEGDESSHNFIVSIAFKMAAAKMVMLEKLTGIKITGDYTSDVQYN